MTMSKSRFQEKRSSPRFPLKDSSAIMLTPGNLISFCMLDVSQSGMAFCYNGKALANMLTQDQEATFFTEKDISTDIDIKIISDSELDHETSSHLSTAGSSQKPYLRRCGLKFKQLSQDQKNFLNDYMRQLRSN